MRPDPKNREGKSGDADAVVAPDDVEGDGDPDDTEETDEEREEREERERREHEGRGGAETRKSVNEESHMAETEVEMVPIRDTDLSGFLTEVVEKAVADAIGPAIQKAVEPLQAEITELRKSVDAGSELTKGVSDFLDEAARGTAAGSGKPASGKVTPLIKNATETVVDGNGEVVDGVDPATAGRIISKGMAHIEGLLEKGIDIFSIHQRAQRGFLPSEAKLKQIEETLETL